MKIGFIILCYNHYSMVSKCIEKLLSLNNSNKVEIIVVDNNSPDKTGKLIKEKYSNTKNINVILNKKNYGYAIGNNIGFKFAKNNLNCECVVVINSDVLIEDKNFVLKLDSSLSKNKKMDIISPDIVNLDGSHANPMLLKEHSQIEILKQLFLSSLSAFLLFVGIDYRKIRKKHYSQSQKEFKTSKVEKNFVPHGSCIIFTNRWVKNEKMIFYPKTFLFCEELFLFSYVIRAKKNIVYDSTLKVSHLEDGSIDSVCENDVKKLIFVNRCNSKSLIRYFIFRFNPVKKWKRCSENRER